MNTKNKILFLSGREINYPRNNMFISALEKVSDLEVIGPKKKEISKGHYAKTVLNSLLCITLAIPKLIKQKHTLIFIGFFGQFLVIPLSILSKAPIYFDLFVSTYDTLVNDRKAIGPNSLLAKIAHLVDFLSCKLASTIFVDTEANLDFFTNLFEIPKEKMQALFVGCDEKKFYPRKVETDENLVIYYSTYMPLHGVDVVVKAAKLLNDNTSIHFKIIGEGMTYKSIRQLAKQMNVTNIDFLPPIALENLPNEIAKASICLAGHFGDTEKAKRVIPGKTFQLLAMKKAVIVGDNQANHELLTHGKDAFFCKMNNPLSLANAIRFLYENQNIREKMGLQGYKTFVERASNKVLEKKIHAIIEKEIQKSN